MLGFKNVWNYKPDQCLHSSINKRFIYRFWFMIYFTMFLENKEIRIWAQWFANSRSESWRLRFKQEKTSKNESRTLACKNLMPYGGTPLAT